jgi:hypothetical protein
MTSMSLEELSLLSQIVSAIVVFASLVFVGIQLKQATKAVRASSSQAHSAAYIEITGRLLDEGFASIWHKALAKLSDLDEEEQVRFFAFVSGMFRFFESSRVQWLGGQLDDEHWHTIEQHAMSLAARPGIQSFWVIRRHWHCTAFQEWFEGLPVAAGKPLYLAEATDPRGR